MLYVHVSPFAVRLSSVFNHSSIAAHHFFRFSWLLSDDADLSTRLQSPLGSVSRVTRATKDPSRSDGVSSSSRAAVSPPSPAAFSPAPAQFSARLAAAAHSPVPVPPPTRVISQRPTDTDRCSSAKELRSGDEMLSTRLKLATTRY